MRVGERREDLMYLYSCESDVAGDEGPEEDEESNLSR